MRRGGRPMAPARSGGRPWRTGRLAGPPGPDPPRLKRVAWNPGKFHCPHHGMRANLTIVGGGLGGLVPAISAREAGLDVTLVEAPVELRGRARTATGAYRA